MNGYPHKLLLFILLFPTGYYLGLIHADLKLSAIFALFWVVGTLVWTPDKDLKIPFVKHRGITHNPLLWIAAGIACFYYDVWWAVSFPITQEVHIFSDLISTKVKRTF